MQKLQYLFKHYTDIVGVGLIDIPNLWTAAYSPNAVTLEEFEVKVLAIEDRAVFVIIPTIITALSIKVIPMRTACLTAHTAQAPITRARYLVCYHSLPSPLPFFVHFFSSRGEHSQRRERRERYYKDRQRLYQGTLQTPREWNF